MTDVGTTQRQEAQERPKHTPETVAREGAPRAYMHPRRHASKAERQVPPEHYLAAAYDGKGRFVSYWHQVDEVRRAEPSRVLEIGVGSGFVSNYLRDHGYAVITLDVNPRLQSDLLGSITDIPFANGSFDVVAACEVLEHLPKADVLQALREMRRVTRESALLSVPDVTRAYPVQMSIPKLGLRRWLFELGAPPGYALTSEHQWEIGHGGISAGHVREWIAEAGFRLERDYRPFEHPYHHFFVLSAR